MLNAHCQAHDVKNLFVADGGPFVSQADKNLTWTIMALSWRTSEFIAGRAEEGEPVTTINRRETLKLLGGRAGGGRRVHLDRRRGRRWPRSRRSRRARRPRRRNQPYKPRFFTAHEYATVVALGDMIIPKDSRSGSASDAGAPEFIDYIVAEQPERQTAMRGGLGWLDNECRASLRQDVRRLR